MATGKLFTGNYSKLVLKDTSTHSYHTKDIYLINKLNTIPAITKIGFYIYNATNVEIDITPVFNVFPDSSVPDATGTTLSIPSGIAQLIPINDENLIANYFSANIKASAAPSGYVQGFAILNYNYTTK